MFRRRSLRRSAWLALIGLLAGLFGPLGAHAAGAGAQARHALITAEICSAGGTMLPPDDAPPSGLHPGFGACVYCQPASFDTPLSAGRPGFVRPDDRGLPVLASPLPVPPHAWGGGPALPPRGPPTRS